MVASPGKRKGKIPKRILECLPVGGIGRPYKFNGTVKNTLVMGGQRSHGGNSLSLV
jgi:hypothetical protein